MFLFAVSLSLLHTVHFIRRKVSLRIKRFDQFTLARSSPFLTIKTILEKNALWKDICEQGICQQRMKLSAFFL